MPKFGLKQLLIIIVVIVALVLIFVFLRQSTSKPELATSSPQPTSQPTQISKTDKPQIVTTKPDPLEDTIISASEEIEITFNRPLENEGEFKLRVEPKIDYKIQLSGDRKTAKIIPLKPYQLGTTYTIFIGTETKFDGVGRWGEEKIYHFRTIKYTGV